MITVTVELISARTGKKKTLGTARICNDIKRTVETTGTLGDCNCEFRDKGGRLWRTGVVTKFPRKRLLAWDLLYRALDVVVGGRP